MQFILRAIFVRGTSPHPVYWGKPGGRAAKPGGHPRLRVQDLCSSVEYKTVQKNVSFLNFKKKKRSYLRLTGGEPAGVLAVLGFRRMPKERPISLQFSVLPAQFT